MIRFGQGVWRQSRRYHTSSERNALSSDDSSSFSPEQTIVNGISKNGLNLDNNDNDETIHDDSMEMEESEEIGQETSQTPGKKPDGAKSTKAKLKVRQHVNPLASRYQVPVKLQEDWIDNAFFNHSATTSGSTPVDATTTDSDSDVDRGGRNPRDLIIDVGCAKGTWALTLAQRNPELLVLGLEIREPVVDFCLARKRRADLTNVHFMQVNANVDMEKILRAVTADKRLRLKAVNFQFPDPHFKKKHRKRRVVNDQLVDILAQYSSCSSIAASSSSTIPATSNATSTTTSMGEINSPSESSNLTRASHSRPPSSSSTPTTSTDVIDIAGIEQMARLRAASETKPGADAAVAPSEGTLIFLQSDIEELEEDMVDHFLRSPYFVPAPLSCSFSCSFSSTNTATTTAVADVEVPTTPSPAFSATASGEAKKAGSFYSADHLQENPSLYAPLRTEREVSVQRRGLPVYRMLLTRSSLPYRHNKLEQQQQQQQQDIAVLKQDAGSNHINSPVVP